MDRIERKVLIPSRVYNSALRKSSFYEESRNLRATVVAKKLHFIEIAAFYFSLCLSVGGRAKMLESLVPIVSH